MKKIIYSFLLFLLIFSAFAQTSYAKEKIKEYLIKKSGVALTIGKISGILPFWICVSDLSYHNETSDITVQKSSFALSPLTLIFKEVTFLHLHLEEVTYKSSSSTASTLPNCPFPLHIHSLKVENFRYNKLPPLTLTGSLSCDPKNDLHLNLQIEEHRHPDLHIHLSLTGENNQNVVKVITRLDYPNRAEVWLGGTLSLDDRNFIGALHGKGKTLDRQKEWSVHSPLSLNKEGVQADQFEVHFDDITTKGTLHLPFTEGVLSYEGAIGLYPLIARAQLSASLTDGLTLSDIEVNYLENQLQGLFSYSPLEGCRAEYTLTLPHIEKSAELLRACFDFDQQIEGELYAEILYGQKELTCLAELNHFRWDDCYISKGRVDCKWEKEKPLVFAVQISDFDVLRPSFEVFPIIHLKATGTLSHKFVKFEAKLGGVGEEPFVITGKVPLDLSVKPLHYAIDKEKPFSLKVRGRGSIDPILSFLENASLIVQGKVDVNLDITGPWGASEITGYLTFEEGRVQDLSTGALFQNISMIMKGEKDKLIIHSLSARDVNSGKIRGTGELLWDSKKEFPFQVNLQAERFLLFALDPFTATTDASITLTGTRKELLVKGEATLLKGLITIPSKLPVRIPSLEVTYCDPENSPAPKKEKKKIPIAISWDLMVSIPRNLEIEGRGFYSEWQGNLRITGEGERRFTGTLNLHEGRFEFSRHKFYLSKGKIEIDGLTPKAAHVDIEGQTAFSSFIVFMNVKGPLDTVHMGFSSSPPMAIEQIFSRLLFDSDLNELTPFQACSLAKFLIGLSGKYEGPSTFDTLKEKVGIDVFDITRCNIDEMDFTFQVGKYISQGTYVGVNKSISGDYDSIEIQTRIYRDFFLQGNYGGSLNNLTPSGGKLIFKWYKSY